MVTQHCAELEILPLDTSSPPTVYWAGAHPNPYIIGTLPVWASILFIYTLWLKLIPDFHYMTVRPKEVTLMILLQYL